MAAVKELIRIEADNTLSFGDYELSQKTKKENFKFEGDLYKVKTYKEITKLEKNEGFLYESVPGTAVTNMNFTPQKVSFNVSGSEDAQITLGLSDNTEYCVKIGSEDVGCMKTGVGGKLNLSIELSGNEEIPVEITLAK